jgi:DNA-binding MarR family transcriptional regulator
VKRPTATRVIANLEEAGLIERVPDPADARSTKLRLTPAGRSLVQRLRRRKTAYLALRLSSLPPDDLDTLERAAAVLERVLEEEPR